MHASAMHTSQPITQNVKQSAFSATSTTSTQQANKRETAKHNEQQGQKYIDKQTKKKKKSKFQGSINIENQL